MPPSDRGSGDPLDAGPTVLLVDAPGVPDVEAPPSRWWPLLVGAILVVAAVLRLANRGHGALSPDETYSAVSAHLPLGEIPGWISRTDPHPPLFYLLLHPLASAGASDAQLRALSALCSLAAVGVMAWWQRRRGWQGLLATFLFAIVPFQLAYGREARMYGLLTLLGVVAAAACWRWLGRPTRGWAALAAVAALAAALSHASGLVLLPGLLLLPGLRRDRDAWEWRAAIVAAGSVFLVLWGSVLARGSRGTTYHSYTTLGNVSISLNEMVAAVPSNRLIMLPLLMLGVAAVIATDRRMGRVLVCAGLVPAAAALVIGFKEPIILPKTFVVVGWVVPVVLAGLVAVAWRKIPVAGALVLALLLVEIVPWIGPTLDLTADTDGVVSTVVRGAADGDAIAAHPEGTMMRWYLADRRAGNEHPIDLGLPDTTAFVLGDGPWNGRVWVVDATYINEPLPIDAPSCAPEAQYGGFHVRCLQLDPTSAAPSAGLVP